MFEPAIIVDGMIAVNLEAAVDSATVQSRVAIGWGLEEGSHVQRLASWSTWKSSACWVLVVGKLKGTMTRL